MAFLCFEVAEMHCSAACSVSCFSKVKVSEVIILHSNFVRLADNGFTIS